MKKIFGVSAYAGTVAVVGLSLGAGVAEASTRCGSANGWGVSVDGSASCPFAFNVANNLSTGFTGDATTFTASSPVTGMSYSVNCWRKYQLVLECNAGNNAVIYLAGPHPGGNAG
jgi:hypothetical protein